MIIENGKCYLTHGSGTFPFGFYCIRLRQRFVERSGIIFSIGYEMTLHKNEIPRIGRDVK